MTTSPESRQAPDGFGVVVDFCPGWTHNRSARASAAGQHQPADGHRGLSPPQRRWPRRSVPPLETGTNAYPTAN